MSKKKTNITNCVAIISESFSSQKIKASWIIKIIKRTILLGINIIYWQAPFNKIAENEIIEVIDRIHGLVSGKKQFNSSENSTKYRSCRFNLDCDRILVF